MKLIRIILAIVVLIVVVAACLSIAGIVPQSQAVDAALKASGIILIIGFGWLMISKLVRSK